ncbi:virion structural protein [Pseudomonas phage 201phi2-1]|uniref:Virion structural protein n=1 Tax=Pseudomonas phage 201phi2-1 TaxID=198110 RepID=B3FJ12_BP201|nr:virion structural protein [Pseudomonas phage 201phi2-1]ABY62979.1 virion structural protein [Pseudomonas phage 201phi2-1]
MSSFKDNLYEILNNPSLIQALALNELDSQLNPDPNNPTFDVPDGTIPFVFLMECGSMETAANVNHTEASMRRLYGRQAVTPDDLYAHMADDDYLGRFANPASTPFMLVVDYDEIIAKAVPYGDQGLKRLVIPRLTQFSAGKMPFTMQYPIQMTVMRHGGVTVEYVLDKVSPVETLTTNIVQWQMMTSKVDNLRRRLMVMTIPVQQFGITTYTDTLNPSALFQKSYPLNSQFFYARAYISTDNEATWTEINTTHSALTYDPMKLTVVLKLTTNTLTATIPVVYVTTGMATGSIRLDIYTTQGPVDLDFSTLAETDFSVKYNSIDDDPTFTAPMNTLTTQQVLARGRVSGGSNAMTFAALREQVINNTLGPLQVPITNVQLGSALDRRGYSLVTNVDDITNLQFLASRQMPTSRSLDVTSGAGVAMSEITFDMETLGGSTHVSDNGNRLTIFPSMLYNYSNGKVTPLPDSEITRLNTIPAEQCAREVNDARYVYSPLHNVMDIANDNFEMRPYYLDNPTILSKTFIGENDTANLQAAISSYDITRIDGGYRIRVMLETGEQFKLLEDDQVVLQLGYRPTGENRWASVNGTFIGRQDNEPIYQFDIMTNFDVNSANELRTLNMSMFSTVQNNYFAPLNSELAVTIIVVNSVTPGYKPNDLDEMVQTHLLPAQFMCVTRESLNTVFGYELTRLWRRSRPVISSESYQKYEFNVPAYYSQTIYETDANGNVIINIKPDGSLEYKILHRAGDPILTDDGQPVYEHMAGDPIHDADGNPILIAPRKLKYETTLFMVDGKYYFANEREAAAYATEIPMQLVTWIQNDIELLDARLLGEAELFLYPTTTYGDTLVSIREGQQLTVPVDQAFNLNYYLSKSGYTNPTIRPGLISNTKTTIAEFLARSTISMSEAVARLTETSGEEVMAIEATGLGGSNNFAIITVEDDAVRLSVRQKLVVLPNQELTIEDDLTFNWLRHTLDPV